MVVQEAGKHGPKPASENRLPLLVISGILGVVGTALFGSCTQDHCHWMAAEVGSFGSKFLPCISIQDLSTVQY